MPELLPVSLATLVSFGLTSLAVVLTPGPDTVLIIRHGLSSGRLSGLATVAGIQAGLAGHTLLAIFGISVLVATSPVLFKTVAVAGAAYLGWLGFQGFRGKTLSFDEASSVTSPTKAFLDGMITNLLNPKVIILFLALLPNCVDKAAGNTAAQLVCLAIALLIINVIWQAPIAWATDHMRGWMARPGVQKSVNMGTGAILVFFASVMLWQHVLVPELP